MSDESLRPEPADKPAGTIWDGYARTRTVFVFLAMSSIAVWMLGADMMFPPTGVAARLIGPTMVVHSFLLLAVSTGSFGQETAALVVTLIIDALWTIAATCFVVLCFTLQNLVRFDEEFAVNAMLILMPGAASFFLTYLLWPTRSGAGQ